MPVPGFQNLMLPMLRLAADGQEHSYDEVHSLVAEQLKLTPAELQEMLPSGRQTRLKNRIGWAKAHLAKAGLVLGANRGRFTMTPRGREVLAENPPIVNLALLGRFPEFQEFRGEHGEARVGQAPELPTAEGADGTPEELLETSYRALRAKLADELLERILASSPAFFERLVVGLLVAMGYGGSREDAGQAVGQSGDGGIDGIIKEDRLGLDAIYIQAKRWEGKVGRPVVQAFAGSLEGHRARKGVLITTSDFSAEAREYVGKIEKKIVLIGGRELTELMIDHDVAVTTLQSYVVKKIDLDYFDDGG